jgi:hypothetical protein
MDFRTSFADISKNCKTSPIIFKPYEVARDMSMRFAIASRKR